MSFLITDLDFGCVGVAHDISNLNYYGLNKDQINFILSNLHQNILNRSINY